jgi:hypothetical protein
MGGFMGLSMIDYSVDSLDNFTLLQDVVKPFVS